MALHRFIHIGDTHLQPNARQIDRVASLEQIAAHVRMRAEDDTLAAVIWPGDLYHAKSTVDDRNLLVDFVRSYAAAAPVLICYGNHDVPGDLNLLAKLDTPHRVLVVDRPGVVTFRTPLEDRIAAFVLPYPHKAGLVAAGVEHQQLGQEAAAALDAICLQAADDLDHEWGNGAIPLMAAHVNMGGAVSSVGQPQIGQEIELSPTHLARIPEYAAVMANHIHKHQAVGRLVYAGSIARMDFGEQEAKGFVEWTWDSDARTWSWVFIRLDTPNQIHVEGRLTREAFTLDAVNSETILIRPSSDLWASADVRCRYRFAKGEVGVLDVAKIHAEFAGCRSLVLEPIAETEAAIRAPEIAAAVTLEEKVHAFAARQGLTVTPGFDAKLSLLQAQAGDQILAAVAADVADRGRVPEPAALERLLAQAGVAGQEVRA